MFNNILMKSFQVGEKLIHVICEVNTSTNDLKNFSLAVIKFADQIDEQIKAQQAQQSQAQLPVENHTENNEQPAQPEPVNEIPG